jgi:hypothetical protein
MASKGKVNVKLQLSSLIFTVAALIGFAHIKKLKKGSILIGIAIAIDWGLQVLILYPFGLITALVISYSILIYFMLKWSNEWNEEMDRRLKPTGLE